MKLTLNELVKNDFDWLPPSFTDDKFNFLLENITNMPIEYKFAYANQQIKSKLQEIFKDTLESLKKLPQKQQKDWEYTIFLINKLELIVALNQLDFDFDTIYEDLFNDITDSKNLIDREIEYYKNITYDSIVDNYTKGILNERH